jgi:hypothetical protein
MLMLGSNVHDDSSCTIAEEHQRLLIWAGF